MTPWTHRGGGRAAIVLAVAILTAVAGCSKQNEPPAASAPQPDPSAAARTAWTGTANEFIESYFKLHPFFAAQAGRHEFDGQMPDWSAAAFENEIGRLKQLRSEVEKMDPAPLEAAQ